MRTQQPTFFANGRGHGSIEEEPMTSGDPPRPGHSGDLPGGGKPDPIPPDRLRELARAAAADRKAELDCEDLE
jgi:hypothetical protein